MLGRPAVQIELSEDERDAVERLKARRKTAQDMALRARIILALADVLTGKDVAARLGVCERQPASGVDPL